MSKFLSPLIRVHTSKLLFVSQKHPRLTEQKVFDCIIQQELLTEVVDLLPDEPVKLVHDV